MNPRKDFKNRVPEEIAAAVEARASNRAAAEGTSAIAGSPPTGASVSKGAAQNEASRRVVVIRSGVAREESVNESGSLWLGKG